MGIEQILLPILGGIAKGTSAGLEERRQQRMQMEMQRNVGMAKTFREKPELYEVPEFRNWANKYYGPQEAKAMYSSARIEKLQNQYLLDERVRTGNPNPEPLSPDQLPPEPVFADFSGGGGGNQAGIMGLISQFIPGAQAAMSKLGIGPGEAQAAGPSTTGPASGPQGYPQGGGWQQAGGPQRAAPQAGQTVGYLRSGRPVVQNADGSTSTHRNMIAGFGDKFYIVPTIYGGKEVTPDQAAQIAQQNNLTDPDTGQKLVGYPTQQAAEQAEQSLHAQLEKEPMVPLSATNARQGMDQRIGVGAIGQVPITQAVPRPGGGAVLTIQGTPPARGIKSAFTRQRPQKIAKGVTISYDKDGNAKVSMTSVDDNLSTNMNEVARRLIDAGRKENGEQPLDMENSDDIALVINSGNTLTAAAQTARTRAVNKEELLQLQDPRWQAAQRSLAKQKGTGGAEGATEVKMRPEVQAAEARQVELNAAAGVTGGAIGGETPLDVVDETGKQLTPNQLKVRQEVASLKAKETNALADNVTREKLGLQQEIVDLLGQLDKGFKSSYSGFGKGDFWQSQRENFLGDMKPDETVWRQNRAAAIAVLRRRMTGLGITKQDQENILQETFHPNMRPEIFQARLKNLLAREQGILTNQRSLLGSTVGEISGQATPPPSATTTPPPPARLAVPSSATTSAPTRTPPINKSKKSKYSGKPLKTDPNVPLNDPSATSAPPVTYQVRQSDIDPATGKFTPEAQAVFRQMIQNGEIDPKKVKIETLSDEEFDKRDKARRGK